MSKAFTALSRLIKPTHSFRSFSSKFSESSAETSAVSDRLKDLREKLKTDNHGLLGRPISIFQLSKRGDNFLKEIQSHHLNKKYPRGGANGDGYIGVKEVIGVVEDYYTEDEKKALEQKSENLENRMRVKISKPYIDHALKIPRTAKSTNPILKVVMPDLKEIADLAGEVDPSNQNRYSPLPGLLHKYEMLLAFVAINCSSHCRYCYRLDLFSGISSKSKADMTTIAAYVKTFNELIEEATKNYGKWNEKIGLWVHKETNDPLIPIREILLSGGDPMTLPNATLARYLALMAEAGINSVRIGTKELAFNPERFDAEFWKTLDLFHATYPEVRLEIVGHYVHPYELIEAKVDEQGKFLYDINSRYQVRKDLQAPLTAIKERSDWIGHHNQFPIIAEINDSSEVLRLLMYQCNRLGITLHNIYACREIPGNAHFRGNNTLARQYNLVEQAKFGLSGIENHGRLVMSTEYGKVEIFGFKNDEVLLRLNRLVNIQNPEDTVIKVDLSKLPENQKFYWLTDEIIKISLSKKDQETLRNVVEEESSIISEFKKIAAQNVYGKEASNDDEAKFHKRNFVTIEVITRNGGSNILEINLDKVGKKNPTLATVLSKEKLIDAVCEKLSCTTCVGEIESDQPLPKVSDDELDLIDLVVPKGSIKPDKIENLRAGCTVDLKAGGNYKFTELSKIINDKKSKNSRG